MMASIAPNNGPDPMHLYRAKRDRERRGWVLSQDDGLERG